MQGEYTTWTVSATGSAAHSASKPVSTVQLSMYLSFFPQPLLLSVVQLSANKSQIANTVRARSFDLFHIASYYVNWVKTSWTYNTWRASTPYTPL